MSRGAVADLRRVAGVIGSFACGKLGELLWSDMPPPFAGEQVERAAAHLSTLLQTADEALTLCSELSLCFAEHQLHVRRSPDGLLCVLAERDADRVLLHATAGSVLATLEPRSRTGGGR